MEFFRKVAKLAKEVKEVVVEVNQKIIEQRTEAEQELIVKVIHDCCAVKAVMSASAIEKVVACAIAHKAKKENIAACTSAFALLELYTDSVNIYKHGIVKATAYRVGRGMTYKAVAKNCPAVLDN